MASGKKRPSGTDQRRRTELVALRLLPEEHALLVSEARARGTTISALLRETALDLAAQRQAAPSSEAVPGPAALS